MAGRKEIRTRTADVVAALVRIKDAVGDDRDVIDEAATLLTSLQEELERLNEQLRFVMGKPYRPKADVAAPGQLAFELLQMLTQNSPAKPESKSDSGDAANEASENTDEPKPAKRAPRKRERRGRDLWRCIKTYQLTGDACRCSNCAAEQVEIGYDVRERFMYVPPRVYILEERISKYACKTCEDGVVQAEATAPAKPIPGSMASASLLAHLIVGKLLDGLPVERLAKRLRRHGIDLATSTLNDWFAHAARMFAVLYALFLAELRQSSLISLDDTPMPAKKARGQPPGLHRGRQWIYLGDLDQVAFAEFTPDWKGSHPQQILEGFTGDIQNDGYAGINPLFRGDAVPKRVGCNDHARRKFVESLNQGDARAQQAVDIYRALYQIEADSKAAGETPEQLRARRQRHSLPLWNQLGTLVASLEPKVGAKKSPLRKALIYWRRQEHALRAFLDDGRLPISNAHVERQIRTVALFRKNSLFFGSLEAGKRHSILLTVLLNCVLCGVNPYDYLVDVIDKIAGGWPQSRVNELHPRRWLELRKLSEQADRDSVDEAA